MGSDEFFDARGDSAIEALVGQKGDFVFITVLNR